jgi:hypothetical protein
MPSGADTMDVVYSIVEGKYPELNLPFLFYIRTIEGFQYFIPIIAIITILGVLWHYKSSLEDRDGHHEYDELVVENTREANCKIGFFLLKRR